MTHLLWFVLGASLIYGCIKLYKIGKRDAYKEPPQGTTIIQPEIDEHSPENLKFDQALKAARLRTKLQDIEKERKEK